MRRMSLVALLACAGTACSDDVSGPSGNNGVPGLPSVGDPLTLNVPRDVDDPCDASPDAREGRVVAVTSTAIVVVDTENPSNGLSDEDYADLGDEFDQWGYPVVAEYFGEPSDLDENERVIAFFTHAVNEYTDSDDSIVLGLFWPGDLFPKTGTGACSTSNFAEVLYLAVPDPDGNASANFIRNTAVSTMGHETQHLVNASRRLYVISPPANAFETIWLNEGLSHATEELMFFERTGSGPGENIDIDWFNDSQARFDAVNQFQIQNIIRFARFLESPAIDSASLLNTEGTLASRGSDWHFLRYAADRLGAEADFWWDLVNTDFIGLQNLTQALGTDPDPWIRDWSAAVYADDGVSPDPEFEVPSWNLRDIYPQLEENGNQIYPEYPLALNELTDVDPLDLDIAGMAVAYVQVDVPASATATVAISSVDPLTQLRLSVVNGSTGDVDQHAGDDAAEVTLDGGVSGTTYVLAALNASTTEGSTVFHFESEGGAAGALVASAAPRDRVSASRGALALSAAAVPLPAVNHRFHVELLERAKRHLTPRVAHARRVYRERERLRDLTDR